ncbi:MAG: hypothetical protein ACR2MQ_05790 [Gemmatimonadaceae bacterium]
MTHRFPLLLAIAALASLPASPAAAQNATHKHSSHAASQSSAAPRIAVTVLPVDPASGDSVRVIISRDFDFGDRIRVVPPDSITRASAVIRAVQSPTGLTVSLMDPRTSAVRQERQFPLPAVPARRDTAIVDSVGRALAARVAERRSALARYTVLGDSLRLEQAKKAPRLRNTKERAAHARLVAARDSVLGTLAVSDSITRADAKRDSVTTDSTLKVLVAHDAFARDSTAGEIRWALHGVADEAEQWITGHRGTAQSRVTYVARGELRVVDADGANDHAITHGGNALSPTWRHDGRAVVYSDMNDFGTQIEWVDLNTGRANIVNATKRGLNITPIFSPDDHWIYFANGDDNRTQLVAASLDTTLPLKRVNIPLPFDCSSPVFSPDGSRIAFVSSRPKLPQIYSVNLDGSGDRLETPHPGSARSYRTSPDWSPDGRAIAFQQQNGDFQVWSVSLPDHKLRKLTSAGENEDPTWAPDARHIALTSNRAGAKAIWILDTQSGRLRQLTGVGDARLAAWSPMLHSAH